ncbi:GntR family transcriptional regulator/MocR family aminotransferase [Mucilaginibacter frigoritolerans]|uniref:GntR family transcriptional regulator/MocR family aminotransferase n=1 Tax=Mucilaginibacter frigoritolerans TaxID=652788 RepID=A0A562U990_9SPHI|nr:PLP-dependent aminotransferase family protein [Mucilaginibacter frigoritolerans]TWJ02364.1 GntR family transcriptional regulator/MocR family aminotransferase [Mucilaginibacter frigoritolerans]
MLPFDTLIPIDKSSGLPAYQQVTHLIIKHIRNGVIKPGLLLPGTREMAGILKLHRKTIIAAYDELTAQGWTSVIPRKGFIVSEDLPEIKPKQWDKDTTGYAFNSKMPGPFYPINKMGLLTPAPDTKQPNLIVDDGHPDSRLAPMVQLHREYRSRLKQQHVVKQVSVTLSAGTPKLREAMVTYMAQTRGLQMQTENILITHGAQMSIYLAASLLLKSGDYVIVGEPGYYVANQVFEHMGARIIRVPVDKHGIDITAVEDACQKYPVKALYVIPHHHHPTTVTLSPERRMRLLEMAEQFNFSIIEDDYDYDFHYTSSPYLPLAAGNHHNRVVYIGSFSKALSATIRIGFMIAATDFLRQAIYLRRIIDLRGDHVMEESLAALLSNGDISRHLKKVNKIYCERRDYLCTLLDTHLKDVVHYTKPDGGMAIWLVFDKRYPLSEISVKAAKYGLFINNGKLFDSPDVHYNALRFGFASLNFEEIKEVVEIITKTVN